jgi:EmrB/QacA subfamily drug resistance transporter
MILLCSLQLKYYTGGEIVATEKVTKRVALLVASVSSFITPFLGSSMNIALPAIGREFSMDVVYLSWLVTSYLLATAVFLVPFGRIADIYGRKRIFLFGTITFTVGSLLAVFAPNAHLLLVMRVLQGLGSAMVFGTGVAILISVYPLNERGKALGINVASVYLGLSLGPTLGGLFTHYMGWRSIFMVTAALGVLVIILVLSKLKGEWVEAAGEKFDLAGSLLYGSMILALMYGFSKVPSISGFLLLGAGVLGLLFFIWRELRVESPVLEMRLFRNNLAFTFSNLAALINYSATFAVGFILSLYLQYIQGYGEVQAGLILVFQPLMQFIFSPIAGRLSDRFEPRLVASIGMGFSALGIMLLIPLSKDTSLGYLIVCLVLLGFGFGLFSSPNTNAVMSAVQKKYYGVASGIIGTMRLLGQMFSMGVVTLIFSLYLGGMQVAPGSFPLFLKSIHLSFIIFAVLCVLGIAASLARGKVYDQEGHQEQASD